MINLIIFTNDKSTRELFIQTKETRDAYSLLNIVISDSLKGNVSPFDSILLIDHNLLTDQTVRETYDLNEYLYCILNFNGSTNFPSSQELKAPIFVLDEYYLEKDIIRFYHFILSHSSSLFAKKNEVSQMIKKDGRIKALSTVIEISKLIHEEIKIDRYIEMVLDLIPQAFQHGRQISTRIIYNDTVYESKSFNSSKTKLTEVLSNRGITLGAVELHIQKEKEGEKFSFSLENLETLQALTNQLGAELRRLQIKEKNQQILEFTNLISSLFQNIIQISDNDLSNYLIHFIEKIKGNLKCDGCEYYDYEAKTDSFNRLVSPGDESTPYLAKDSLDKLRILRKITFFCGSRPISYENYKNTCKEENGKLCVCHIVQPVLIDDEVSGLIYYTFKNVDKKRVYDIKDFRLLGHTFSLAISKHRRERTLATYKKAIEQNPSAIVITDMKGSIKYVNPRFTQVTGYLLEEVEGKNPRVLKSGEQDDSFYKKLWQTITGGDIWKGTFHNRCKDGTLMWELAVICPIKNDQGKSIGFIAIKEDITEKVNTENELRLLNSQLKQTQMSLVNEEKMASVGRLAAGLAHEINNPIGFIMSNQKSMLRYIDQMKSLLTSNIDISIDNSITGELEMIMEDVQCIKDENDDGFSRVQNVIDSLRSFSRIDNSDAFADYDLNEAVRTTLVIARSELESIDDVVFKKGSIPEVNCKSDEINQVILNIIVNAAYACRHSQKSPHKIQLETYREEEMVCLSIQDSGNGIPEEIKDKIFEPFFTSKPIGEGTGLGLNIAYDIIVVKHNGVLEADNLDTGARFIIKLPLLSN